jgi:hypothetical protein
LRARIGGSARVRFWDLLAVGFIAVRRLFRTTISDLIQTLEEFRTVDRPEGRITVEAETRRYLVVPDDIGALAEVTHGEWHGGLLTYDPTRSHYR